ncbi:hypothetical protein SLITO_v1c05970 [Spiroplasma litorale]|uniref:Uncharacterized protein n=1 Tax=Spiroplasma litorale TaxID=216942 RepID=A0A0K1W223_9MOLU|nr:DUF3284 domain-containing protein [Spiroplasma litorale]AKX34231.1 hypothetical protein SLITO_v1c05970 [Spiroplasma litorale]
MMSIFKKNKISSNENNDNKLGIIDNLKSYHTKKNSFNLPYPIEKCFYGIIKLSFSSLKSANWRKISEYSVNDVFKSKVSTNKFTLTELKLFEVYELRTTIEGIDYWTRFELTKIKENKTEIKFSETIKFTRAIYGFKGTIAKMNFNKKYDKNSKEIIFKINKEVKEIDISELQKN